MRLKNNKIANIIFGVELIRVLKYMNIKYQNIS